MFDYILVWWPDWAFASLCSALVSALGTSLYAVLAWTGLSPVPVSVGKGPEEEALDDLRRQLEEEYRTISRRLREFAARHGRASRGVLGGLDQIFKRRRGPAGNGLQPVRIGLSGQIQRGWQLLLDMLASAPADHKRTCKQGLDKLINALEAHGYLSAHEADDWRKQVDEAAQRDGQALPLDMWTVSMWRWGNQDHSLEGLFQAVADKVVALAERSKQAPSGEPAKPSPDQPAPEQGGVITASIPNLRTKVEELITALGQLKDEALRAAEVIGRERPNGPAGLARKSLLEAARSYRL